MKKIAVILPVNNSIILNETDLLGFQDKQCQFQLMYIDTHLTQLTCPEEIAQVIPLVKAKINEAIDGGIDAVIVYSFGGVCLDKSDELKNPPMVGLGRAVMRKMATVAHERFTVIPALSGYEVTIERLLQDEGLLHLYRRAPQAVGLQPEAIRTQADAMERLYCAASAAVEEDIDTLTIGCGSFIGLADQLQLMLQERYGDGIQVFDAAATAFDEMRGRVVNE